jgi:hypothetical protein
LTVPAWLPTEESKIWAELGVLIQYISTAGMGAQLVLLGVVAEGEPLPQQAQEVMALIRRRRSVVLAVLSAEARAEE